jgi:hypothetical protein
VAAQEEQRLEELVAYQRVSSPWFDGDGLLVMSGQQRQAMGEVPMGGDGGQGITAGARKAKSSLIPTLWKKKNQNVGTTYF